MPSFLHYVLCCLLRRPSSFFYFAPYFNLQLTYYHAEWSLLSVQIKRCIEDRLSNYIVEIKTVTGNYLFCLLKLLIRNELY